tara:strand:- start:7977 stop:9011 length:1035 start_codon:yes stop_codon:yes gene_type:complete
MSTKQNNEEEVDLGSLFIIIGNGFKNFFNFIGSIFKGIFHFFILILLFFKSHLLKLIIAAVIGGVVGVFLENTKEDKFGSNLLVQPNFNSTRQLYKNVNYYNDLVKQKKIKLLASTFNIDTTKALKLRSFEINPVIKNSDVINSYNDFILSVDTLTVKSYTFDQFKRSFADNDYKVHEIKVEAIDNSIFNGLGEVIIASVVKNDYFKRLQKLNNENLFRTDSLLKKNLVQVDSLRQVYMKVMLEEAKKESLGTSIDLGGKKNTTKEIELFDTDRKIISELKRTSQDIAQQSEVINIVSGFQIVGYQINRISRNYIFLLSAAAVLLLIFFILLLELNKYLNSYKK